MVKKVLEAASSQAKQNENRKRWCFFAKFVLVDESRYCAVRCKSSGLAIPPGGMMMTKQKRKHVVVPENVPIEGKSPVADVSKKDTKMEKIRISTLGFWQNVSSALRMYRCT